ncbi:S9 family peptidase [Shewanella woodyi]|uniref:Peptidase S9 prolyl oligopeptidase active site domain protein n=1 Tax=Shewanella woodyi (strain ATCC 51908 / MS32) TaxID=392500 RepID=B1KEY8_SHEWM|nr:prolyl oligopeptidase family serine peptidase [Shewanella woodyi]ACA85139.1 peptidase S9 prolyl oligopeptidase active site domain protein [Shewanella woodyi ATCC 51908]
MKKLISSIIFLLCFFTTQGFAEILPLEYFAKPAQFTSIKLSPNGKYFAATVPKENTNALIVVERKSNKRLIAYGFGHNEYIGDFYWGNNERLVYTKSYKKQGYERKGYKGEIFAANIDGSKRTQLYGFSKSEGSSKRGEIASKRGERAWGYIVQMLTNDDKHILIRSSKWNTDRDAPDKLYKINIYNQKRTRIATTPLGNISVVTNSDGIPVIAKGKDRKGKTKRFTYKNGDWQEITKDSPLSGYSYKSLSNDGKLLYMSKAVKGETSGLYEYNFETKKVKLLFNHPVVDINAYVRSPDSRNIIAVETMMDGMKYHYLDKSPFALIHQQIAASFPQADISIRANSIHDEEMIVKIITDRNPGDFYLFNQKKKTLDYLLSAKPWIYPEQMQNRKLIHFDSRDGQKIHGYLTLPKPSDKPHPLIVDVHGGPYGPMDKWHYDSGAQMWANNGFAVLQINFRGSGGYGKRFKESTYLERSTTIQHDIIDGTRWALGLKNISDDKVCITGGSFGGYSALMSALMEPELYRCSIPMYGAYDLVYQMKHADYMDGSSVSIGAMEKYGDNEEHWRKESPLTYIDKLKTPLMIVTGGRDKRVPPQSALHLQEALDKRNISYEWLYKAKEGHGFVNTDNRVELYQKSLAFARKHIQ